MSTIEGLALLARSLPHAAARRLGAAFGRLAGGLGGAHRRASANLRAAFPDLEARHVGRLAREASAQRTAAAFDGASASRFDGRALCRHLTLDRWSCFDDALSPNRGLIILGAGFGCWQLAALAVALYRGPIETLGPWRDDPVFGRLAASFERRSGGRLFGELAGGKQVERALLAGARVGFRADRAAGHGEVVDVPFLGRTVQTRSLIARASIGTGAPVVPVFGLPRPRGRWSVEVREPIPPADADARTLTARYLGAVESEVRRRPELWLGWWSQNIWGS